MEVKTGNREWVKNAAIIFLVILLILTFFSNTIMNRTLPEITTAYAQSNTITPKVKGTGRVEAQGAYEVKAPMTQEIRAVLVKVGQEVAAGDTLFVLGEGESQEIEAAAENLRQLRLSYSRSAISTTDYAGKRAAAQEALAEAEKNLVLAESNMTAWENSADSRDMQAELERLSEEVSGNTLDYELNYKSASDLLVQAKAALETVTDIDEGRYLTVKTLLDQAIDAWSRFDESNGDRAMELVMEIIPMAETAGCYEDMLFYLGKSFDDVSTSAKNLMRSAMDCHRAASERADELDAENNIYTGYKEMYAEAYNNALAQRDAALAKVESLAASAESDDKAAALDGIGLSDLSYQIKKAEEKLNKLTGSAEDKIYANTSGIVSAISVSAGQTAAMDQVLATIEVPDMGYSMSFTVTTDQAKRLRIGDTASVQSYYWGRTIEATLTGIQPDPKNPQTNKLLVFTLTGDVSAGNEVTISVGEKSSNYDLVIPTAAIRTDTNGTYVLMVEAKNSALANRYFAKRANVQVVASDDTNSAVTGDLEWGDYVITTSSAPIKSGDQVRMAEG